MSRALFLTLPLLASCATAVSFVAEVEMATEPADPPADCLIEVAEFDDMSVALTLAAVAEQAPSGTVQIRINSYGGSIMGGLDLIQGLEELKKLHGHTVICTVDSKAYSMGFVLLQGACDVRQMTARSSLLAHNGSIAKTGGNAEALKEDVELLEVLNHGMATIVAARLGITVAEYKSRIAARSWILSADQALKENAADLIADPMALPALCRGE